ncbi:MAG: SGNH/GDSL hydrolase family protein [Jhaorihella sp.]
MRWPFWLAAAVLTVPLLWAVPAFLGLGLETGPADRPLRLPPPDGPLRIVFLGTSLTASYGWPDRLADCAGRPLAVSRIARAGAASDWGLTRAEAVIAQRPDIVFIEFSVNDADLRHAISLHQSADNHRRLIEALRAELPGVRIVLMTMSPAHGLRRLLRPRLPAYYGLYRDLAEALDTGLLDLYPRWRALPRPERQQDDGLHPAETAAARLIVPGIGAYLGLTC